MQGTFTKAQIKLLSHVRTQPRVSTYTNTHEHTRTLLHTHTPPREYMSHIQTSIDTHPHTSHTLHTASVTIRHMQSDKNTQTHAHTCTQKYVTRTINQGPQTNTHTHTHCLYHNQTHADWQKQTNKHTHTHTHNSLALLLNESLLPNADVWGSQETTLNTLKQIDSRRFIWNRIRR